MIKDGRADGALVIEDRAEAEEVGLDQVDGRCLFEGPDNRWGVVATQDWYPPS